MTTPDESNQPDPSDEQMRDAKKEAEELEARYAPDARQSVVVPGSDGTLSGTAFADDVEPTEENQSNRPPREVPGHSTPADLQSRTE